MSAASDASATIGSISTSNRTCAARRTATLLRGGAACLAIAFGALLCAPTVLATGAGNAGLGSGGGDEGIGSLPSMIGGPGIWEPGKGSSGSPLSGNLLFADAGAPNLWVEGPTEELAGAIQAAWGNGYVTVQAGRNAARTTLFFHGDVKVAVNATAIQSGKVAAGVWLSPAFQASLASIEWNGQWTTPVAVGGNVNLPLAAAAHAGLFQRGGTVLHLAALKPAGAKPGHPTKHASVSVTTRVGAFVLEQKTK